MIPATLFAEMSRLHVAFAVPLCGAFKRFPAEFSQESRDRPREGERKKEKEQVPRGSCILFRASEARWAKQSADANRR